MFSHSREPSSSTIQDSGGRLFRQPRLAFEGKNKQGQSHHDALAATLLLATLAACGGGAPDVTGRGEAFAGLVTAEEPRAAAVARDVLATGGNAADAAVALAFTLTVTYPVSAGLGGGGVCLVADPKNRKEVQSLEFLPRFPREPAGGEAVPALSRGLLALHARHGQTPWGSLVMPAEILARTGSVVSRALARALAAMENSAFENKGLRTLFAKPDGTWVGEGEGIVQPELAHTLAHLRLHGLFHEGEAARALATVTAGGGPPTVDDSRGDLRGDLPRWQAARAVPFGYAAAYFVPSPTGHEEMASTWAGFAANGFDDSSVTDRIHLAQAFRAVPKGHSTGFIVADHTGRTVACTLTLNDPVRGQKPVTGGATLRDMEPMLIVKRNVPEVVLAGTIAGGTGAVLLPLAAQLVFGTGSLDTILAAPRIDGGPDGVLVEKTAPARWVQEVRAHIPTAKPTPREVDTLGRVTLLWCPESLPPAPATCQIATDPRGHGLAMVVKKR
ncbi:MAG: gamma-glutamyltranspeptidase [Rhodospirillaceae bacterium]|nr:MAG: gamma-glutamyltranspeptidase [Rhodospirillaceae bacterium]